MAEAADAKRGYQRRLERLRAALDRVDGPFRVRKRTSNLFRYVLTPQNEASRISLDAFHHVLGLDEQAQTLEVEGLATYESVVAYTLSRGYLPTVAPELKHITVAGAVVGIGIESTCFKYGFAHDGLVEADVLLPDGRIVRCRPDNEHAILFRALPNSYGTLGYILRAVIRVYPAKPYVRLENCRHGDLETYMAALERAALDGRHDFVESVVYGPDECVVHTGRFVDHVDRPFDIYRRAYYKQVRACSELGLRTIDYIFRFDPDWFWNIGDSPAHRLFRRLAPRRFRNSGFYRNFAQVRSRLLTRFGVDVHAASEPLIQDWEVPWAHGRDLVRYALEQVDLEGRPWVGLPIVPQSSPTSYPVEPGALYFNLGCYCYVSREPGRPRYELTRLLDERCFALSGLKMLYSSTFLSRERFETIYNGPGYRAVKDVYDPDRLQPTLFEKVVYPPDVPM